MKTTLLLLFSSLFCAGAVANEDALAHPTSIHTTHLLPAPWHTGEIIARVDYAGEHQTAHLLSLAITIGKHTTAVPRQVLALFPGVRLGSLQLFYGPPLEPEFGGRRSCNVTFRFGSYSNEDVYTDIVPTRLSGRITIEGGSIVGLTQIEDAHDITRYIEIDPKTLKEIRRYSVQHEYHTST